MHGLHFLRYAALGLTVCVATPAVATQVYFNDFQGAVGSEWSRNQIASAPNPDYNNTRLFLGEFGNDTVGLSLNALPNHDFMTVSFSLYLIRSWDGNDTSTAANNDLLGVDHWRLVAGGQTLLDTSFSNGNLAGQTYDGAKSTYTQTAWTPCTAYQGYAGPGPNGPMTGANECFSLGYKFSDPNVTDEPMDSVYELSFTFPHIASAITLNFGANGLQTLADESWGLDNVRVSVAAVPIPAAVWLFGTGLVALVGLSRRRK